MIHGETKEQCEEVIRKFQMKLVFMTIEYCIVPENLKKAV